MSNVTDIKTALTEVMEESNVVELDPMRSLEALLGRLEHVCDDIHTSVRSFAAEAVGSVVRISKRSGTEDSIRKQLVHLKILSMTKAKKLSTRRLADFIKKSYWRIEQAERRVVRNLDRIGKEYGYDIRKQAAEEAQSKVDPGNVVPLPFNMKNHSPYDHMYRNLESDPQDGGPNTDFGE